MGGSSKNKECALIKCKTKEQQKKKLVAPCTCTLPVSALLCTSSSNAHLALYLSRSAVVYAPLLHIALLSLRSLSRVLGVVSFFWFFFFAMVNLPFVPNKKRGAP
jgi:hypothetical protein